MQNEENEKRAAELIIANEELAFQNEEKEKRAAELDISNKELRKAENDIRQLNADLEQKVIYRTIELESANHELESFSYSVSHDLCAPLRIINSYIQILKDKYADQLDPNASAVVNNIMANAKRMGHLINDLLLFSHTRRTELVKVNIPVYELVEEVCAEIQSAHAERKIEFKISELPPIYGDRAALRQVWVNLLSNAVKYSKLNDTSIIEIGAYEEADTIIYHIHDNGVGFSMKYVSKLFTVFQRLHTDEHFEGTGIGLAIVHRIISKHGGRVWADSKENEGATFYFSLPV